MTEPSQKDMLYGFDWYGRSEPIRIMYCIRGEEFDDHRIGFVDWPTKYKHEMPMGAVPVLKTSHGTINQSNAIARYVAKRLGFMGESLWEEALHDSVLENVSEAANYVTGLYMQKVENGPEPPKSYEQTKEFILKVVKLIQNMAQERGKKFIIGDQIGLGEIWLYTTLQYYKLVLPDILEASPWLASYEKEFESLEEVKKYLKQRPKDNTPQKVSEKFDRKSQ